MIRIAYLLWVMLLLASPAYAESQKLKTVVGTIYGDITISEAGLVSAVKFNNVKDPKIAALLESQVKKWEFHPMLVNGKPQLAQASFTMNIFVTQDSVTNKAVQIVLDDVFVLPTALELTAQEPATKPKNILPQYPMNGLRSGIGARLKVAIKINAQGRVERAAVKQFAFLDTNNRAITKLGGIQREFILSAIDAVKKRRYSESEMRRFECVGGCFSFMDFEFTTNEGPWHDYREVTVPAIDWYPLIQPNTDFTKPKSQLVRFKLQPSSQPIDVGG
jgi:hypothetical protein